MLLVATATSCCHCKYCFCLLSASLFSASSMWLLPCDSFSFVASSSLFLYICFFCILMLLLCIYFSILLFLCFCFYEFMWTCWELRTVSTLPILALSYLFVIYCAFACNVFAFIMKWHNYSICKRYLTTRYMLRYRIRYERKMINDTYLETSLFVLWVISL